MYLESGSKYERRCLVWSKNGIEHYYPRDVLREVFSCSDSELESATYDTDPIVINGISVSKTKLAELVVSRLGSDCEFDEELHGLDEILKQVCQAT